MHFIKAEWKRRIYNNLSLKGKLRFKVTHKICMKVRDYLNN